MLTKVAWSRYEQRSVDVLYLPFPLPGCATDREDKWGGSWMFIFRDKVAVPTLLIAHHCFPVGIMDASCLAGLHLLGRSWGTSLLHSSLTCRSWLWTSSFNNPSAPTTGHTPQPLVAGITSPLANPLEVEYWWENEAWSSPAVFTGLTEN